MEGKGPEREGGSAAGDKGRKADRDRDRGRMKVGVDMTSRFLGLIVVPGPHITKIEVERGGLNI